MPQSLTELNIHLVFSTKYRRPLITDPVAPRLHAYIAEVLADECRSPARIVGGVEDHVHILLNLARTWTMADVVKVVKRNSSVWMKTLGPEHSRFYWQLGYGAFAVSRSDLKSVENYIANQREHHRSRSFQDEFRLLLAKHEIDYDERYVWD